MSDMQSELERARDEVVALRAELAAERDMRSGQLRDLALLSRVAVAANEASTIGSATDEIVALLAKHVGWPSATAWLRHGWDGVLRSSGSWYDQRDSGLASLRSASDARLHVAPGSVPGRVGLTGAPIWIEDATALSVESPGWLIADGEEALGIGSAFAVPVWFGREVVGVVGMFRPTPCPRDDALLELVEQVATQLGFVVGRLSADASPAHTVLTSGPSDRRMVLAAIEQMWRSLADIAHEIRTPLSGVLGTLELLAAAKAEGGDDLALTDELLASALASATRLHDLIEHKLNAAEAELALVLHEPEPRLVRPA